MSEYVFDFDRFEEPDLSTGLREPVVRCRDCTYARKAYWHDGERERAEPSHRLCGYFGGRIQTPCDFFCAAGKERG